MEAGEGIAPLSEEAQQRRMLSGPHRMCRSSRLVKNPEEKRLGKRGHIQINLEAKYCFAGPSYFF